MSYLLKDNHATVIHIDDDVIRASIGLGDLFNRPTITLRACYGVPRAGSSNGSADTGDAKGWLVGEALTNVLSQPGGEDIVELKWPFQPSTPEDWEGREYLLTHLYSLLNVSIPTNSSPLLLIPPASPPTLPLTHQALYTQLAFEVLNVPGFSLLPLPLASLFALNATTGLILHIGRHTSSVWVVVDSVVRWDACVSVDVGQEQCEKALEGLLMSDPALDAELKKAVGESWQDEQKAKLVREVCGVIWKECLGEDVEVPFVSGGKGAVVGPTEQEDEEQFDVAKKLIGDPTVPTASHSHKSKKQQAAATAAATKAAADAKAEAIAAAALDVISIQIPSLPDKEISVGPIRHRLCEPLLSRPDGKEALWEGIGRAVGSSGLGQRERLEIWEAIGIVGDLARVKSFGPALMTYLSPFLLSSADLPSDTQPAHVRLLHIPEYFANFKGCTSDLAPFLGGSMVAKVAFNESAGRHCVTKVDYNARGPAAVYAVVSGDRA